MKKFIGILACSSLLLSSLPALAEAPTSDLVATAEKAVEKKDNVPTSERLEDVIKIVKPLLDVPEKYENFTWCFNGGSYYSRPSWFFSWSDEKTGEISVRCDNEGRLFYYEEYSYEDEEPATVPEDSPAELEHVARAFIKKLLPYTADSELVLTSTTLATVHRSTYGYEFTRYENGIPVPDNTISVTVNYRTKKAEGLTCNYNADITFDSKAPAISLEQAKEILGENQSMKLSYRLKTEYDDETGNIKSRKAYLVYTPETDYISVDAYTGEIYTERNTWTINDRYNGGAGGTTNGALFDAVTEDADSFKESESGSYTLTEKELQQLEVLDKLITKDTAIAVITNDKSLYLDESATAVSASLSLRYDNGKPLVVKNEDGSETIEDRYAWHITFSTPDVGEDNFSYRTYATVDANDGSLISFSASTPDHWYYTEKDLNVPEIKYTADEAEKIATDFLKKLQPEKFENLRLYSSHDSSPVAYSIDGEGNSVPVYGNKNFIFTRVNEGVDFEYNAFNVSVSLINGKVTLYNFNWYDDVEFESPKNVISPEKALECFYSYDGFGLNYEINSNYTYNKYLAEKNEGNYIDYDELYKTEIYSRPVYSAYNPGTTIIRATDGVMITGSGSEYEKDSGFSYENIENHWIKETAERLGYLGIGFKDNSFSPDDNITGEKLTALLRKARIYGYDSAVTLSEEESVTRTDAVKYILSSLGFKKVAQLKNTFITNFADGTAFKEEDLGFIAIARGFGIIDGDGVYFRPYDALTEAEALSIIEKVINAGLIG